MARSSGSSGAGGAPIFLVGTGRCGSTIAYSLLAMHPDLAWIPSWVSALPRIPALAFANRVWSLPGTDRFREIRFVPKPVEPIMFFRHHLRNYTAEHVDDTVLSEGRARLVPMLERIRRSHGRARFLGKLVGRPVKVELLAALFPDAYFVHVTRDLRPTVSSFLKVDFYERTGLLDPWPWSPIPPEHLEFFEQAGRPQELVAAIQVTANLAELNRQLALAPPERQLEVPYAAFVADPIGQVRRVCALADLPVDGRYERRLLARRLVQGADQKWMKHFDAAQIRNLDGFEALTTNSTNTA
ncbi:MAG TPA: sulfotransferase [Gemmatimonadales bacterium]